MTVNDIIKILDGTALAGKDELDKEVLTACGSDMMSDVLAFCKASVCTLNGSLQPSGYKNCRDDGHCGNHFC